MKEDKKLLAISISELHAVSFLVHRHQVEHARLSLPCFFHVSLLLFEPVSSFLHQQVKKGLLWASLSAMDEFSNRVSCSTFSQ
jgi:hypothetical protein